MDYVLGVDVGNTKTIALLARHDGLIMGEGRSGCGDIYGAPTVDDALLEIESAVLTAVAKAGISLKDIVASGFSMAGADWPEDYAFLQEALERRGYGRRIKIVNDAIGGLYAGSPDATGVVIVCGTGAATGARSHDGHMWHTSFWQEPQGARQLSGLALKAVYSAELGVAPPTALTSAALAYFDQQRVEDILHHFTSRHLTVPHNANGFARILLDTAAEGDAVASDLVQQHGKALGDYALVAARHVGIEHTAYRLVLIGGVLRHPSRLLSDAIIARVRAASPQVEPVYSAWEPAAGALLIGFETAGIPADAQVREALALSMPTLSLFAT